MKNKLPGNVAQFFPQPYPGTFCDNYNCRNQAKHFIGKPEPQGTWNLCLKVCDDCARDIISSIPEEFKDSFIPPDGMTLVSVAELEELRSKAAEQEELQDHQVKLADAEQPDTKSDAFHCPECGKEFTSERSLQGHVNKVHGGKPE